MEAPGVEHEHPRHDAEPLARAGREVHDDRVLETEARSHTEAVPEAREELTETGLGLERSQAHLEIVRGAHAGSRGARAVARADTSSVITSAMASSLFFTLSATT